MSVCCVLCCVRVSDFAGTHGSTPGVCVGAGVRQCSQCQRVSPDNLYLKTGGDGLVARRRLHAQPSSFLRNYGLPTVTHYERSEENGCLSVLHLFDILNCFISYIIYGQSQCTCLKDKCFFL